MRSSAFLFAGLIALAAACGGTTATVGGGSSGSGSSLERREQQRRVVRRRQQRRGTEVRAASGLRFVGRVPRSERVRRLLRLRGGRVGVHGALRRRRPAGRLDRRFARVLPRYPSVVREHLLRGGRQLRLRRQPLRRILRLCRWHLGMRARPLHGAELSPDSPSTGDRLRGHRSRLLLFRRECVRPGGVRLRSVGHLDVQRVLRRCGRARRRRRGRVERLPWVPAAGGPGVRRRPGRRVQLLHRLGVRDELPLREQRLGVRDAAGVLNLHVDGMTLASALAHVDTVRVGPSRGFHGRRGLARASLRPLRHAPLRFLVRRIDCPRRGLRRNDRHCRRRLQGSGSSSSGGSSSGGISGSSGSVSSSSGGGPRCEPLPGCGSSVGAPSDRLWRLLLLRGGRVGVPGPGLRRRRRRRGSAGRLRALLDQSAAVGERLLRKRPLLRLFG